MEINIKTLDRKVFRIALDEESERQTMHQNMVKSQIKRGTRFDGDEDFISEIDRLKESFKKISRKRKDIIEISDEEFKFLERLVKNQTIISNGRIQDWIPDGVMVKHFKARYFEENKNATEEKFEACRLDIIKYDEDLKICMQELANILGIEYNPNLK
jgi:hypothetical protein